jgi:hypothetical protein
MDFPFQRASAGRIRAEKELRQSPAATSVTATTAEGVVQGSEATESFEPRVEGWDSQRRVSSG